MSGRAPLPGPFAFGHEFVADVLEIGDAVRSVRPGDRVIVPFQVSCGTCELLPARAHCELCHRGRRRGLRHGADRAARVGRSAERLRARPVRRRDARCPARRFGAGFGRERLRQRSRRMARGCAGAATPAGGAGARRRRRGRRRAVRGRSGGRARERSGRLRRRRRRAGWPSRSGWARTPSSGRSTAAASVVTRSRSITAATSRACTARCGRPSPRASCTSTAIYFAAQTDAPDARDVHAWR